MSKSSSTKELPLWRIFRLKGTPAADIGTVAAPDAEAAIKTAIEKFAIPESRRSRLMARRVG